MDLYGLTNSNADGETHLLSASKSASVTTSDKATSAFKSTDVCDESSHVDLEGKEKTSQKEQSLRSSSNAMNRLIEKTKGDDKGSSSLKVDMGAAPGSKMRFPSPPQAGKESLESYGLNGILRVVRLCNTPLSLLSLGTDLTTLGLNLNAPDTLYASFLSPNLDQQPPKDDAEFFLPPCYYMNPPNLKMTHLQRFTVETLFYMFHTIIGDVLQGYAAAELFNRGWLYHTEYQKWFTPASALPGFNIEEFGGDTLEATWIYFEPALWRRQSFTGEITSSKFLKASCLIDFLGEAFKQQQDQQQQQQQQQQKQLLTPEIYQSQQTARQEVIMNHQNRPQQSAVGPHSTLSPDGTLGPTLGLGQTANIGAMSLLSSQVAAALQAHQQNQIGSMQPPNHTGSTGVGLTSGAGTAQNMPTNQEGTMTQFQSAVEAILARGLQQQQSQQLLGFGKPGDTILKSDGVSASPPDIH